jgi:NAD(P)-dependent dehydrogenase (short-subunit alcohol dehydrogenase family)
MAHLLRFDGKVALITGAGDGFGREYALLLAKRGAKVMINDLSNDGATETQRLIEEIGGVAATTIAALGDRVSGLKIVTDTLDKFGRIDIVINNAGNFFKSSFEHYTEEDFTKSMGSHFGSAFWVTQAAWPHFKKQQYGRVVMITSQAIWGTDTMPVYSASKAANVGLSNALALEGAAYGIKVNAVAPSGVTAGLIRNFEGDKEMIAELEQMMPRWAPPCVIAWLVHESCKRSGDTLFAIGSSFGKIFIGETKGVYTSHETWTPEYVRDHYDAVLDETGYLRPLKMMDCGEIARRRFRGELK